MVLAPKSPTDRRSFDALNASEAEQVHSRSTSLLLRDHSAGVAGFGRRMRLRSCDPNSGASEIRHFHLAAALGRILREKTRKIVLP